MIWQSYSEQSTKHVIHGRLTIVVNELPNFNSANNNLEASHQVIVIDCNSYRLGVKEL